jgi:hypothetical protein
VTTYNPPLATLIATIENGTAETEYAYNHLKEWELPANDPGIYVIGYSAWCPPKRSEEWTVELWRPEVTEIKWEAITYDKEGKDTGSKESEEVEYRKAAIVRIKTKDIEDGEYVNISVVNEATGNTRTEAVEIKDGKGFLRCNIEPTKETLAALKEGEELSYSCSAIPAKRGKVKKGTSIKVTYTFVHTMGYPNNEKAFGGKYVLENNDGSYSQSIAARDGEKTTDNELKLKYTGLTPGHTYSLYYLSEEGSKSLQFEGMSFYALLRA